MVSVTYQNNSFFIFTYGNVVLHIVNVVLQEYYKLQKVIQTYYLYAKRIREMICIN